MCQGEHAPDTNMNCGTETAAPWSVCTGQIWQDKGHRGKLSLFNFQLGFESSFERYSRTYVHLCVFEKSVLVHRMFQLCLVCSRNVKAETGVRRTLRLQK